MKKRDGVTVFFVLLFVLILLAGCKPSQNRRDIRTVAFLTDWGESDYFVGACKGVILSINPHINLVDISHGVTPFDIVEGAYTLLYSAREFPEDTIFLAIVDPGVGTERKPVVLITKNNRYFIAPDNGILTLIMNEMGVKKVHEITNKDYFRPGKISKDFHGRDIFSPVAAHISRGVPASKLGTELDPKDLVRFPIYSSKVENAIAGGYVVYINQYGNIIVNITQKNLDEIAVNVGDNVDITIGDKTQRVTVGTTYGDVEEGEFVCFIAANDILEIAINLGNANGFFDTRLFEAVKVAKTG